MASNDKKPSAGNDHAKDDQNSPFTDAGDQILLKALQDLIVRVVDPKRMNDINQVALGPEAAKLITALQEFVTSIIGRAELMSQNTVVEVSLDEGRIRLLEDIALQSKHDGDGKEVPLPTTSSVASHGVNNDSQRLDTLETQQPTFQEQLLKALRDRVFNTMPIRMLSFEPQESGLQITLLEREVIHTRLVSVLGAKIHQEDHQPIFRYSDMVFSRYAERRLETDEEAIERLVTKYARYAILSHTWRRTSGEITYNDWKKGLFNAKDPGYQKLVKFCKVASKEHGLTLGWMDTVCINKESSSELDESIRSMYNWYSRAAVCITYLAETASLSHMHIDHWFTRGWTLQELVAPRFIKFYNCDWKRLTDNSGNDKDDPMITERIEQATTISKDELDKIHAATISRRMQLAATREVTREEDTAYSLMGIFDVSFSTAYGEGAERAFFRLLQEILASPGDVLGILNWAGDLPSSRPHASRILPSCPQHYLKSSRSYWSLRWPIEPLTLTHLGLRVPVVLMPALSIPSQASQYVPIGDYSATIDISPGTYRMEAPNGTYNLLDNRISGRDGRKRVGGYQLTLAVFNFFGDAANICLLKPCIAKVLRCNSDAGKVTSSTKCYAIDTDVPVVFDIGNRTTKSDSSKSNYTTIKRDELVNHGMQLVSLYL